MSPGRSSVLRRALLAVVLSAWGWAAACEASGGDAAPAPPAAAPTGHAPADTALGALPDSTFAALVARLSEPGGYFDTDNLISNERGYLKVMGALDRLGVRGGAYLGVGPDQNFSYVAQVRPAIAFLVDIRRDNLLHHLLLKALVEASPTRVEFLSALHGRPAPDDPGAWEARPLAAVVAWVDGALPTAEGRRALESLVERDVQGFGVPLDSADLATIRRFHRTFMDQGLDLRFTSFGRAPRPQYPTYRQLLLETDLEGREASWLASAERYATLRALHLGNRLVPVVGDLAGRHALREIGAVLRERGLSVTAVYASNVEFYLWGDGTFGAWAENAAALPAAPGAVVIRSYFPNAGRPHPSAVPGYHAAQALQPLATLAAGGFASYWEVVTRDAVPLF